jgi:lipocalin-like protein
MSRFVTLALVSTVALSGASHAFGQEKKPSEVEITNLLPGKWASELNTPKVSGKLESAFVKDCTYTLKGKIKKGDKEIPIDEHGTWEVTENRLVLTPKNPPDGSPKTNEFTIVEISDTTFKMKDKQQIESIWTRVKE